MTYIMGLSVCMCILYVSMQNIALGSNIFYSIQTSSYKALVRTVINCKTDTKTKDTFTLEPKVVISNWDNSEYHQIKMLII